MLPHTSVIQTLLRYQLLEKDISEYSGPIGVKLCIVLPAVCLLVLVLISCPVVWCLEQLAR